MKTGQKKIKIALFSDGMSSESFDGVSMTLYTVFNKLPRENFDVLLISAKPPTDKKSFQFRSLKIPSTKLPFYKDYPIALPSLSLKLKKELNNFNPDIIHITTPFFSGPYALKYANKNKIPTLTIYHTHFLSYLKYYFHRNSFMYPIAFKVLVKYLKNFYNKTNIVLVPTEIIKNELINYGIKPNLISTWRRGIDTNVFNPNQKDLNLYINITKNHNKNILFVGRLVWYKGLQKLIEIYNHLETKRDDVNFIIIGDGPHKNKLQKHMPKAFFLGKLPHKQLPKFYASADCFLFTSDTETFGNVVLEAMACGCPVVVSDAGGPSELVTNNLTGFKIKDNRASKYSEKIEEILDNPKIKDTLSKQGIKFAQSQSWEELTQKLINFYNNLYEENLN
ncbi:MAG: glycosyl transferase family 1 [Candidatus Dojkabacteria bacterium]|nr:MAG: glycosyl transferase family 1 [Candidatus Dojkabacteria bacterium]